jgi:hypothetical protein
MSLRPFLAVVILALAPAVFAADLSIVRVFGGWRDTASFKRISEYFDGKENTGREIVLRSHPEQRSGYYFLVRFKNSGALVKGHVHLELIGQNWQEPRTTIFPVEIPAGTKAFQLGLTGPEWQDAKVQPMAWHLRVIGENGEPLATEKSYLWEKPPGK